MFQTQRAASVRLFTARQADSNRARVDAKVLSDYYIRTARAKGLSPVRVVVGHALPSALRVKSEGWLRRCRPDEEDGKEAR